MRAEINPAYHVANQPFFDSIEIKGGGDAVSAARAVLQTGQYDGRVEIAFRGRALHLQLNQSDPWTEVDGERSSVKTVHPWLTDPAVRGALALLVDRMSIQQIYGRTARATGH